MEQITCDLIPGGKMPLLHASQYDEGREYRISLTENKQAYTLDGTELLTVSVRKGDNTLFTADIANTFGGKSYVDFVSTEQMCAVAGYNFGELSITKNNTRIGTINFTLMVEPSPEEGGVSQSEINNLARQVEELVDDEMGDYLLKTEAEETYATITALETLSGVVDTKASASDLETLAEVVDTKASKTYVDTELDKKADTSSLAEVATSGSYNDLTDKPTIPEQVQSDWNEADNTKPDYIKNKPNLSTVATSGSYNDLLDKPSIPVIDDTTEVADKVWSSKKTYDEIVAILPTGNASGSIANFNTSLALPMEIVADVNAKQEEGTPTPQSPKAISGVSVVNVTHCGANIWDEQTELGQWSDNQEKWIGSTVQLKSKNFIPILPETTYRLKNPSGTISRYVYYDKNKNYLSFTSATSNLAFTTPANAYYMMFGLATTYGTTYQNNVSINYPSTDTTYHAYNPNGTTTLINLGGTYYGGYVSQDKNGKRELVVTHNIKVFDGTETFTSASNNRFLYTASDDIIQPIASTDDLVKSSHFASSNQGAQADKSVWKTTGNKIVVFRDSEIVDLSAWQNFVISQYNANTPLQLVYKLATPIEIELPDGEPINALVGTNNVYADSGDIEVTYKKSIDDAIAELQALILG